MNVTLNVKRFNPDTDQPIHYFQEYELEIEDSLWGAVDSVIMSSDPEVLIFGFIVSVLLSDVSTFFDGFGAPGKA